MRSLSLQPIDYTSARGGVSVLTNKAATTISSLILQRARHEDGGDYSCHAGGALVKPPKIKVHVMEGEEERLMSAAFHHLNLHTRLSKT